MNSFSGYSEFQKITNIILLNNGNVDWDALEKTSLSSLFSRMARTYQNPKYHGEIDVLTHTKMVCEEMVKQDEYKCGSDIERTVLFWAALLHDIGKIACTVLVDGELKSPYHSVKGEVMAREMLWRELGLCGDIQKQQIRESICNLIRYHSFPPYAMTYKNVEQRLLRIASNGALATYFSIEKLCALERADMLGRVYADVEESLERVEWCKAFAEESGCLSAPYKFADDFSQRAYFKGKTAWKEHEMFNDSWGRVILMSGLSGTGKDTYIRENYADIPMISLDEIRKELNVSPTEKQGKVVSFAQERAREYLRKKQPFVWNATNITAQTRSMQISLFEAYGASVEAVFLETEWETQMNRNRSRNAIVPTSVIENMLSKLTLPERYESESVLWKTV